MGFVRRREGRPKPWQAVYQTDDGSARTRSFRRKLDAERWLTAQTAAMDAGGWVDPAKGRTTLRSWVARWRESVHHLRPTTKALNLGIVDSVLLPQLGDTPLAKITASRVRDMVNSDLDGGNLSASAIRRRVIVLSTIMQAAVEEGLIGRNPCQGVRLPAESRKEVRFLEPDQVRQLADTVRPEHYRPLIYTAAYVGLRFGELAGLGVEHVDVLGRRISVERTLVDVNGKQSFGPPKSKAGRRTVTMPAGIAEMLGEHIATEPVRSSGLVFPTITGQPMRRPNWRTIWRQAVEGVFTGTELAGLKFHELRHSAAAMAIAQGAHPMVIKERLGHSSITTTLDVYGGLFPSQDAALADALDHVLTESLTTHTRPKDANVKRLRRSEG